MTKDIIDRRNKLNIILDKIQPDLKRGERLHPDFAEGVYQALGFLGEEYGEVSREITKGEPGWEKRMDSELFDLIVVAIRMLLRDYERKTE